MSASSETPSASSETPSVSSETPAAPPPRRRRVLVVAVLALVLLGADLARPPADQLSARMLLAAIDLYQATLSPRMPGLGVECRFEPTCSHYGEAMIERHGALVGSAATLWRVLRCGPWTPSGTVDPPT